MKPASSTLINLLASNSFVYCDCYTITPVGGGAALRYTTADIDIAWAGDGNYPPATYKHGTVGIASKSKGHWKRGLDVDSWQVTLAPRPTDPITGAAYPDMIGSVPFLAGIRGGLLRGADLIVDRAYLAAWPTYPAIDAQALGMVRLFRGTAADVTLDRGSVQITADDYRKILTNQMPCNLWQAPCRHVVFGTGCGLSAASFRQSGSAVSGSTASVVATSLASPVNPPAAWTYVSFSRTYNSVTYNFDIPVFASDPGSPNSTIFLAENPTMPDGNGNQIEVLESGLSFTVTAANGAQQSGTMLSGTQNAEIITSLSEPAQNTGFTLGAITMTSGQNAGISRTIRLHTPGTGGAPSTLTLLSPFPFAVAAGDGFTILPGCNRSLSACKAFGNQVNFGGTPFIPAPETAV